MDPGPLLRPREPSRVGAERRDGEAFPISARHLPLMHKKTRYTRGSGHTCPQAEPSTGARGKKGKAQYRERHSAEAREAAGERRERQHAHDHEPPRTGAGTSGGSGRRTAGRARGAGMGGGGGAAGCDQDTRTYSARPRPSVERGQ